MREELKPCPFCGSSDISLNEEASMAPDKAISYRTMCRGCGVLGPPVEEPRMEGHLQYTVLFDDGIKAWNTRIL